MASTIEIKMACLRLALDRPKYAGGIKTPEDLVSEARIYEAFIMENNAVSSIPMPDEKRKGRPPKQDDNILGF